jgi:transposase
LVIDNLSSDKGRQVRVMIEAAGARLLCLPPYGRDFNPIDMAFAKLKALLRKVEPMIPALWDAIGRLIDLITPYGAANSLKAAGH